MEKMNWPPKDENKKFVYHASTELDMVILLYGKDQKDINKENEDDVR